MRSSKLKMIFKFGMTVIVLVAIIIYFLGQREVSQHDWKSKRIDTLARDNLLQESVNIIANKNNNNKEIDLRDKKKLESKPSQASHDNGFKVQQSHNEDGKKESNSIHLSLVVCGERFSEVTILLKSVVLFSSSKLVFHIFSEQQHHQNFKDHLEFWPERYRSKISYHIYDIVYPSGEDPEKWKNLFKPCASQRLFIPDLLSDVDSLIYVDTDIIFVSPIEQLHNLFYKFNSTQLMALAPESEDSATGWYNRFARHPFYGLLGVNSGVMLMNLTRLRQSKWLPSILKYYKEYNLQLTWGDQDLINIYFYYYPQELYVFTCEWNFRPDHCMYMSVCKTAETEGVKILHGSRRVFFNEKQPAFRAVYTALKEHSYSSSIEHTLHTNMYRLLKETEFTNCGKLSHIFIKQIEQYSSKD